METPRATSPVFTDDSGRRAAVLQWLARGVCAVFALAVVAVSFTLVTHVPLPGLDGLLPPAPSQERAATGQGPGGASGADPSSVRERLASIPLQTQAQHAADAMPAAPGTAAAAAAPRTEGAGTRASATIPAPQPTARVAPGAPASSQGPGPQSASRTPNPHSTLKSANAQSTKAPNPNKPTKTPNAHAAAGRPSPSSAPIG